MAIKIITGKPRAGKTYFGVWHLVTKYFEFDKILKEFTVKSIKDHAGNMVKPIIITNIAEFKLPHITLESLLERFDCIKVGKNGRYIEPSGFFNYETQQQISHELGGILVYVIDEAHELFPCKYYNEDCFNYFRRHGHFGHEYYLITQYWPALSNLLTGLAEYEIKAVSRTMSAIGEYRYHYLHNGEVVEKKILKPDPWIHSLYRSAFAREVEKPPRPIIKMAMLSGFLLLCAVGLGVFFFVRVGNRAESYRSQSPAHARAVETGGGGVGGQGEVLEKKSPHAVKAIPNPLSLGVPAGSSPSGGIEPIMETVAIQFGGAWVEGKPVAVDFFGRVMMLRDLPYAYTADKKTLKITVYVPAEVAASVSAAGVLTAKGMIAAERPEPMHTEVQGGELMTVERPTFGQSGMKH